eukprot:CAMPEP_0185792090 /NCGR_PEP_ID=MMETSP1174-20130828/158731_1 /TAXON_ID=35687 /ORGANISM="Dictyocha speculum, Strain CCMP1381" /LENGTH=788 /DNA_ID=CAMNT_0028487107 /DNA_START=446 /DNA_END=2812 /DNA_ORIENTATION=-
MSQNQIMDLNSFRLGLSCKLSGCDAGKYGQCELVDALTGCYSCKVDVCHRCPVGKYSANIGAVLESNCTECEEGKFNSKMGSSNCSTCSSGHYASETNYAETGIGVASGASFCLSCPPGKYQNESLSAHCYNCQIGYSSPQGSTTCTACQRGKYADSAGIAKCINCPEGKYGNGTHVVSCERCRDGTWSKTGEIKCTHCTANYYRKASKCVACPDGAACPKFTTLQNMQLKEDYWRSSQESSIVLRCPELRRCRGGYANDSSFCKAHFEGPYCAVCKEGYWKQDNKCISCRDTSVRPELWVLSGVAVVFMAIGYMLLGGVYLGDTLAKQMIKAGRKYRRLKTKLKITVCFTQIMAEFPLQFVDVVYPDAVYNFYRHASVYISLNLYEQFRIACNQGRENHYFSKLLVVTLTPLGLVLVGAIYYAVQHWKLGGVFDSAALRGYLSSSQLFYFYLLTYVVFVPCSSTILKTFHCDYEFDRSNGFMFADYTTQCGTAHYRALRVYAMLFLLVYPIGIPAMYFSVLYHRRNDIDPVLNDGDTEAGTAKKARWKDSMADVYKAVELRLHDRTLDNLQFLFESYEPEFWWWEVLVCAHRLIMTTANTFLPVQSSILACILLAVSLSAVKIYTFCDPYLLDSDDIFAEISHWNIVIFLIFNLVLQLEVTDDFVMVFLLDAILISAVGMLALICLKTVGTELFFFKTMGSSVVNRWSFATSKREDVSVYKKSRKSMRRSSIKRDIDESEGYPVHTDGSSPVLNSGNTEGREDDSDELDQTNAEKCFPTLELKGVCI